MLFRMLPIRLKNFNKIIKKIQKQIFRQSKIRHKIKTESVYHTKLFSSRIRNKKTKRNENSPVKIDHVDPEIKRYTYAHTHIHTHTHTRIEFFRKNYREIHGNQRIPKFRGIFTFFMVIFTGNHGHFYRNSR